MHCHPPRLLDQGQAAAGRSLKAGAGSAEVGTTEYSHLPRSRDTLDQHPLARWSWASSARKMPSPIAVAVRAHRSQPSAAAGDVVRFQSEHSVTAAQMYFLLAQEEILA